MLVADLRGSFSSYGGSLAPNADGTPLAAPLDIDRPNFIRPYRRPARRYQGIQGCSVRDGCWSTDQSSSPNVQAEPCQISDLHHGRRHPRPRPEFQPPAEVSGGATIDRTDGRNSPTVPRARADDRNFNQCGGVARISYDLMPGVKAVRGGASRQARARRISRPQRLCAQFHRRLCPGRQLAEFSRLFGEISIGYAARLCRPAPATAGWTAHHGLADLDRYAADHCKFYSDTQIAETTLPGTSGVLVPAPTRSRSITSFRRWLTGIGRFTYGTLDYQGDDRTDKTYSLSGDLIYRMTRSLAQGHAAAGLAGIDPRRIELSVDGCDAGGEGYRN